MPKLAKALCDRCHNKVTVGEAFCRRCGGPTRWASHQERTWWEVAQWRTATKPQPAMKVPASSSSRARGWFGMARKRSGRPVLEVISKKARSFGDRPSPPRFDPIPHVAVQQEARAEGNGSAVRSTVVELAPDVAEPTPEVVELAPDVVQPETEVAELAAEVVELEAEVVEPAAEVVKLEPEVVELTAEVVELEPEVVELETEPAPVPVPERLVPHLVSASEVFPASEISEPEYAAAVAPVPGISTPAAPGIVLDPEPEPETSLKVVTVEDRSYGLEVVPLHTLAPSPLDDQPVHDNEATMLAMRILNARVAELDAKVRKLERKVSVRRRFRG